MQNYKRDFMRLKTVMSLVVCLLLVGMFSAVSTAHSREKNDADPLSGEWEVSFYVQARPIRQRST